MNATAPVACKRVPLPLSPHQPAPYSGPSRDEVLALRRQYLDGFAGIVSVSVGHCHPKVVEKVREQVGKLQHTTTIYLHPTIGLFGKKLAEKMPAGSELSVTYFTN